MAFATRSIDAIELRNNAGLIANAAADFKVSLPILTTVAEKSFSGPIIADACGDVSTEAHDRAMDRMVQVGVRPLTSVQYLLELQRDWARGESYELTTGIAKRFGGGYGLGLIYAKTMFNAQEG